MPQWWKSIISHILVARTCKSGVFCTSASMATLLTVWFSGVSTHQSDYIKSQNSGAGYYLNEKGAALVPANAHSVYIIGTFAGYYASSNSDCITTPQYQQGYASGQMNQTCNLLDGQFKPPLPASSPDANGYYPQPDPSTALPMVAQIGRIQCIDDY